MPTLVLLILCSAGQTADPAGKIVIRPGGASPSVPTTPDRPGMIVIRPQAPGTRALETSSQTATRPLPTQASTNPLPVQDPKPVTDPKPANTPPPSGSTGAADPAKGRIISETWDVAFVKGYRVGYFHVAVREFDRDGKKYIYATKRQEISMARFGQVVKTQAEDATLETPDGTVVATRMSQEISTGQKLVITGQVQGEMLRVRGEGLAAKADSIPWPEGVIGFAREQTLYKDRKPKVGDTIEYYIYEGRVNKVVKITVKCLAEETVALLEGQTPKPHLKLEAKMEKIGVFQIPPATIWCDAETFEPVRTDQDLPSLGGRLTLVRTTKEIAERPVKEVPDLFDVQSIRLDKDIPNVHDKASVTYTINLTLDPEPYTCFTRDDRQSVSLPGSGTERKIVELKTLHHTKARPDFEAATVVVNQGKPVTLKAADMNSPLAKEIFLGTSTFIDWDNDLTRQQAAQAVAGLLPTASVEDKAKAIEAWVNKNMKAVEFSQAMAPTSQVSKNLTGDCTEFSMLAVGMCRALGIPARTALGLVYAPTSGKPVLAYHMWFEVWNGTRWAPFDATLAKGGIGPGHLKITDAHWHKENSFAPLLPVLRVLLAQPKVEITAVEDK